MGFLRTFFRKLLVIEPVFPKQEKGLTRSLDVPAGTTTEIFRFQVPTAARMVVTRFANYIDTFDAWGLITWIFKRNGIPIYPYTQIQDQFGFPSQLAGIIGVEMAGGDAFTIDVINDYSDVVACGIVLRYEVG